jgi:hypothetical protein
MYGYNQPVNLDEGMLKLILALGDTDVNLAIHNNDIKSLITLLKNKNLLVQPSNTFMSITEQQKDEILSLLGLSSEIENSRIPVVAVVALVWLWVGVYAQAVAINQAVAAVNVAAVGVVVTWIKAWSILDKTAYQGFLEENPFLRIYGLKTEESNTYIAADTYLEQFVSEVADGLETNYPSAFDEMPKDKFMQVLKLNIINNQ